MCVRMCAGGGLRLTFNPANLSLCYDSMLPSSGNGLPYRQSHSQTCPVISLCACFNRINRFSSSVCPILYFKIILCAFLIVHSAK